MLHLYQFFKSFNKRAKTNNRIIYAYLHLTMKIPNQWLLNLGLDTQYEEVLEVWPPPWIKHLSRSFIKTFGNMEKINAEKN